MIHFDDRRDAFGCAEPEYGHVCLRRHRIAVERHDAEDMAGESEAADFGCARIEHMEQHALALLDADGFAVTEHPAIDAEQLVADFEALGLSPALPRPPPFPSACSALRGPPASTSIAMSPPRLKDGANSFITRKTSRS